MKDSSRQIPKICLIAIALFLIVLTAVAQSYPSPYPRNNAKEVLQNERVNVWDVTWPKGQPTAMHEHTFDQLSITLRGGTVRVTRVGGTPSESDSKVGSVSFVRKGTIHMEEGMSDVPQHKVMLELKPSATTDGIHGTAPGEGAIKVFENDRLIAWDFTWKPGEVVSRQAENLDSVTVFLDGGTIRSIADGGKPKDTARNPGEVVYSAHSTPAHSEEAVSGSPRAIIVELK